MAPMMELAGQLNLEDINRADIKQAYYTLFQEMIKDFVTLEDLAVILAGNSVNTAVQVNSLSGTGTGVGSAAFAVSTQSAKAKALAYASAIKTGAVVREEIIDVAEEITT
jgi:IMP dehydrogenase/GMP reductase